MKFVINVKTYPQASGKKAFHFLRKLEKSSLKPIVCLQPSDLYLARHTSLEVWSQHVDPITYGSHTGWILPENVKEHGVKGTLINHSEHPTNQVKEIIKRCREVNLKTMLLAPTASKIKELRKYKPDILGVEPPELIGSKTESVCSKPQLIQRAVKNAGKIPLYIGAGVHSRHDIVEGRRLGAKGVLIASYIVKAKDPLKALQSISQ